MKIGIIGLGRAGMNLAKFFSNCGLLVYGYDLVISDRIKKIAQKHHICLVDCETLIVKSEWLLLAVPDDVIEDVVKHLPCLQKIKGIGHTSGATDISVFDNIEKCIAKYAFHPIRSFASVDDALNQFNQTHFGFEGSKTVYQTWCRALTAFKDNIHYIESADKVCYHLAAVQASNFTMSLLNDALIGYRTLGFNEMAARQIVASLATTTLDNFVKLGPQDGLTGPVARGDIGTLKKHDAVLNSSQKIDYRYMVNKTYQMVKPILSKNCDDKIKILLKEWTNESSI